MLLVVFHRRLVRIFDIDRTDRIGKRSHTRFLIVGKQTGGKTSLPKRRKERSRLLRCRRTVRNKRIIDIKNHAPVSFPVQIRVIDRIGTFFSPVRVKHPHQYSSPVLLVFSTHLLSPILFSFIQ